MGTSETPIPGPLCFDANPNLIGIAQRTGADLFNNHRDFRKNAVILAGIQRVIHRFFQRRQDGFRMRRKTDLLKILEKYSAVLLVVIC